MLEITDIVTIRRGVRFLFALALLLPAACSSSDAGSIGSTSAGGGSGGSTGDGGGDAGSGGEAAEGGASPAGDNCATDVPCSSSVQCAAMPGTSCNTALSAPRCQTEQCGALGSACSSNGQCAIGGICAEQVCRDPASVATLALEQCLERCPQTDVHHWYGGSNGEHPNCDEAAVRAACEEACVGYPDSGWWTQCQGDLADPDSWEDFIALHCQTPTFENDPPPFICGASFYCRQSDGSVEEVRRPLGAGCLGDV